MSPATPPSRDAAVLIVGAATAARAGLCARLARRGFRTAAAGYGAEALAHVGSGRPDVLLVELGPEPAAALETCRALRLAAPEPGLPILAVGEVLAAETVRRALEAGVDDWLARPLTNSLLEEKIQRLLRSGRALAELTGSRARLAALRRLAQTGIWEWQVGIDRFWWSEEVTRLCGLSRAPRTQNLRAFLSVVHADDRERVEAALRSCPGAAGSCAEEYRLIRPDGSQRWVRLRAEAAGPALVIGMLQDISEIRQAGEQLRLFQQAVESLPIGITVTDVTGKIIYANPAQAQLHGCAVDELLHREARMLGPPRLSSPLPVEKLFEGGVWRRESVNLRRDGEEFPVHLSSIPLHDADGTLLGMVTTCEDISERKAAEQRIRQLAYYDTLTGLPNRWMVQDRLQQTVATAARDGRQVGVMFLDLDRFKDVNDSHGHEFGDRLLRAAAQRLALCTREADTLGRLGGDEFVIVLANVVDLDGAAAAARRVLEAFRQPFEIDARQVYSGVSIGIAIYPTDGHHLAGLLQSADTAMYHAKTEGRQTYRFFSPEMNQAIRRNLALENGLRRALDGEELAVVYQPQWDLATGRLTGVEARLRWHCPELGCVPSDRLIAVAERTGLIRSLGEWLLRTVCTQAAAWLAAGRALPKVAVNISGHQLRFPDFVLRLDAILAETGLPPDRLELECSESGIMDAAESLAGTLAEIRARGIQLGIDDFGTGRSSLSHLQRLPLDRIKIDRSFVSELGAGRDAGAIVEAVVALGRSLKLKVLAEGVESREQLEFLKALGCDEVQGGLFSGPLAAEDLDGLLCAPARAVGADAACRWGPSGEAGQP